MRIVYRDDRGLIPTYIIIYYSTRTNRSNYYAILTRVFSYNTSSSKF